MQQLGSLALFLGTETATWTIAQFQQAAQTAKSMGFTSLLVKIADGANIFYGNIGGWKSALQAVSAILPAIPYTYCYGNTYGALQAEIAILQQAMQYSGIVVADMEVQYNGQVIWAQQVCTAMKPVAGVFGVTTWADPSQQNWTGVLTALAPCVNFWMPQAYTDVLAGAYQQEYQPYGLPVYPVLYLGTDFGTNNLLQNVLSANSKTIAFWEYQSLAAYSAVIGKIVSSLVPPSTVGVPPGWSDDGTTLTAPNNIAVTGPFRAYVLANNWDSGNLPLENEQSVGNLEMSNPALGAGVRQTFRWARLERTATRSPFVAWLGQELLYVEQKLQQARTAFGEITTAIQAALK